MEEEFYPEEIRNLPEIDVSLPGVKGYLMQGRQEQLVFFDIGPIGEVKPHSHGPQWGVVLQGEMVLTIGEETRTYRKGDSYYIPGGVIHSARFNARTWLIDFFAQVDRYQPRSRP
ncbi:MAG: cupin domain-containing protein [Deltaproteobacteria bacterium]|nr:cupin domain-containing protein [Deltaproteobacteria bacterium]MBW2072048.1 cupin domain-containing protein [Deltaproteobacteria bacterium]